MNNRMFGGQPKPVIMSVKEQHKTIKETVPKILAQMDSDFVSRINKEAIIKGICEAYNEPMDEQFFGHETGNMFGVICKFNINYPKKDVGKMIKQCLEQTRGHQMQLDIIMPILHQTPAHSCIFPMIAVGEGGDTVVSGLVGPRPVMDIFVETFCEGETIKLRSLREDQSAPMPDIVMLYVNNELLDRIAEKMLAA